MESSTPHPDPIDIAGEDIPHLCYRLEAGFSEQMNEATKTAALIETIRSQLSRDPESLTISGDGVRHALHVLGRAREHEPAENIATYHRDRNRLIELISTHMIGGYLDGE